MNKIALFTLALTSTGVLFLSCNSGKTKELDKKNNAIALPIYSIDTSSANTIKDYIGTIEGKVNVEIRPQVEGILEEIYVDEGDFVKADQKLFKINASAYDEILNNMVATENVAKAKLQNARLEMERLRPLVENEVISEVRLKSAHSEYDVAKASLQQASAAVRSADIDKQFTTIKAPVSGYIGRIPKRVGNLVTKNDSQSLTVLSDVQEVYVYFSMSESDFLYFTKKQAKQDLQDASYKADGKIRKLAFPEVSLVLADGEAYSQKGRVDAVNGQVNRTTGAISLRATFPNTDNILRTGSTGTLKFVETQKGVIQIPQVSTSELQDKTFVYVVDNKNTVHRRSIKIEGKSNSNYIISEGLAVGDRILMSGFDKISEGATIIPINKTK